MRPKHGLLAVASGLGFLVNSLPWWPYASSIAAGRNDFRAFYGAAVLVGSGRLYDAAAMAEVQMRTLGASNARIQNVRLPYYAALSWPLAKLPYRYAYAIWQLLSLSAVLAFLLLWPIQPWWGALLCCWFPPLTACLANGQDVGFLLLVVAVAGMLIDRDRPVTAGLVLSLGAAKFHLFVLLPLMIIRKRMWRFGMGLAAGGSLLLAGSFLVGGPRWPEQYWAAITNPAVHPYLSQFSLMAAASGTPVLAIVLACAIVVGAWLLLGKAASHWVCLSIVLAGGLLLAFHVYLQDYLLALPLVFTMLPARLRGEAALLQGGG